MRLLTSIIALSALSACGSLKQADKAPVPSASEQAAIEHGKTLAPVTLIRVPVGTDGKEISEKAEMRLSSEAAISSESVAANFSSAKAPEAIVDELDKATSTESYRGYRSCGYNNYGIGYGNGYGN